MTPLSISSRAGGVFGRSVLAGRRYFLALAAYRRQEACRGRAYATANRVKATEVADEEGGRPPEWLVEPLDRYPASECCRNDRPACSSAAARRRLVLVTAAALTCPPPDAFVDAAAAADLGQVRRLIWRARRNALAASFSEPAPRAPTRAEVRTVASLRLRPRRQFRHGGTPCHDRRLAETGRGGDAGEDTCRVPEGIEGEAGAAAAGGRSVQPVTTDGHRPRAAGAGWSTSSGVFFVRHEEQLRQHEVAVRVYATDGELKAKTAVPQPR